jgi:Uma2 family endonuclease
MATATRTRNSEPANLEGLRPYRLTVRQVEKMMDAGILTEDDRVELLGGILAEQMTKYPPHNFTVARLGKLLDRLASPDWIVRDEKSVILGKDWWPEPDLAVIRGPDDRYRAVHPHANDIALLVEVAESSYRVDRDAKWHGYAAARVPSYWIVNLDRRVVEVYTNPTGRGKTAKYRDVASHGSGDAIPVIIEGRTLGTIAVNEIMP